MPVSDFECQIARGQIGRYLSGGVLSPQAMRGLEEHLDECPACKALVAERRAALMDQLDGPVPTHAVVSMPARAAKPAAAKPAASENPLVAALRARTVPDEDEAPRARSASAPRYAKPAPSATTAAEKPVVAEETKALVPTTKPLLGKPLLLTAVLAAVLIGMSYLTKGNGGQGALGGKASESFAPQRFASEAIVGTTKPAADGTASAEPALPTLPKADAASTEPTGIVAPSTPVPLPPGAKPKAPTNSKPASAAQTGGTQTGEIQTGEPQTGGSQTAPPVVKPKPAVQKTAAPQPAASKVANAAKPAVPKTVAPKPRPVAVRRSAPRPVVRRRPPFRKAAPPAATAKRAPAVRVYGPDGKPINP